jgi:hypothetical protein
MRGLPSSCPRPFHRYAANPSCSKNEKRDPRPCRLWVWAERHAFLAPEEVVVASAASLGPAAMASCLPGPVGLLTLILRGQARPPRTIARWQCRVCKRAGCYAACAMAAVDRRDACRLAVGALAVLLRFAGKGMKRLKASYRWPASRRMARPATFDLPRSNSRRLSIRCGLPASQLRA